MSYKNHPITLVFDRIDDIIQAVKSNQVKGMLLDRYAASYYQTKDKLDSLITVKKFEFRREVGILFSKDTKNFAECLNVHRSNIWRLVQTITATYKVNIELLCNCGKQLLFIPTNLSLGTHVILLEHDVMSHENGP